MARQVLPIAGAFIGSMFGSAQLGFAIGSIIGNVVDPQRIKGPTLKEIPEQTAGEGGYRQVVYGTCVVQSTNIIDFGDVVRIKTKTRQGKGGGPVVEGERLERTYAIGLGEPLEAVRVIWRNGKIVYDVRPGSTILADSAEFAKRFRFYTGSEDQLPDPDLEALPRNGVGNTPAYRGTAYLVFPGDDLTDLQGRIPVYQVEGVRVAKVDDSFPLFATNIYHYTGTEDALVIAPAPIPWTAGPQIDVVALHPSGQYLAGSDYEALVAHRFQLLKYDQEANSWDVLTAPADYPESGPTSLAWHPTGRYLACGISGFAAQRVWVYELVGDTLVKLAQPATIQANQSVVMRWSDDGLSLGCSNGSTGDNLWVYDFDPGTGVISGGRGGITTTGDQTSTVAFVPGTSGRYIVRGNTQNTTLVDTSTNPMTICDSVALPTAYSNMTSGGVFINETDIVTLGDALLTNGPVGIWRVDVSNTGFETIEFVAYPADKTTVGAGVRIAALSRSGELLAVALGITSTPTPYLYSIAGDVLTQDSGFPATPGVNTAWGASWRQGDGSSAPIIQPDSTTLVAIIADVCDRCGLDANQLDLAALTDEVRGITLGGAYSGGGAITTLMPAYLFDLYEADKKLRAVKRGAAVKATVTIDDLIESPDESTLRGQDIEFPRALMLKYLNPGQDYAAPAAVASRTSPDIRVRGEATIDLPISFDETQALNVANVMLKVMWEDLNGEVTFSLPAGPFAWLTPSDCLGLLLRGALYRIRVEKVETAAGVINVTARMDRQSAYTSNLTAIPLPAPTPPPPSLAGITQVALMNLPALDDDQDLLGFVVGVSGLPGTAWYGAQVDYSADGGLNWLSLGQINQAAVMGSLTAPVAAASEFYTDTTNTVNVALVGDDELESITDTQLLNEGNPAAIVYPDGTAEIIQFRDVQDNGSRSWTLSHLLRGRLATGAGPHLTGARFVMLDGTRFFQLPSALIGQTIKVRATSLGTSPETAPQFDFVWNPVFSQREFPAAHLFAERDGDDVICTAVPRHRFGSEINPVASANWTGYRWNITDGVNSLGADTPGPAHTFTFTGWGTPLTVTVALTNRFTGAGPSISEVIA